MLFPILFRHNNYHIRSMLWSLVCCFIVVSLAGCGDNHQGGFNRFLLRQSAPEPAGPIFKKQYNSSALSRIELDNLLKMSTYSGSAERYGVLVFRKQAEKRGVNPVIFSHQSHRTRFTCKVCHLELDFIMKKGAVK